MRHLSDDDLARYLEGDLRPRRAARVGSHLAGCSGCQGRVAALKAIPNMLANVQYPPIPERLASRIGMALAAESSARVAGQPASEGGRRDLPDRAAGPGRLGWRMPRLNLNSPVALRTAAAVGAAAIIAGGGYAIVSHVGSSSSPASTSIRGPSAAPAHANVQAGPSVSYQHGGHTNSIKTLKSGTDYKSATLAKQAAVVLAAARRSTAPSAPAHSNGSMSTFGASSGLASPNASAAAGRTLLEGCVDRIAAGRSVLLVDAAKFDSRHATIIMVSSGATGRAQVYAVGSGCSASASDILAQQSLPRS
jgi:hypothetical protein